MFTFEDLSEVVGGLPPSAYAYREWWANTEANPQGRAWLAAGRRVTHVSLDAETVRFSEATAAGRRAVPREPSPVIEARIDAPAGDLPDAVDAHVAGSWQPVGRVSRTADGDLVLPEVKSGPAVYRFVFTTTSEASTVYVGETVDVRRRMRQYRRPSGNQQTSRRINALLSERVAAGDLVMLQVLRDVRLRAAGSTTDVDLSSKAVRVLVEHAALLELSAAGYDVHNL
jgi:hypothetical protein